MSTEYEKLVIHSGKAIPRAGGNKPPRSCLSRSEMRTIHLMPTADPICFTQNEDGSVSFYFSPDNVTVTPAEIWYSEGKDDSEALYELPDGSFIPLIDKYNAETLGMFTAEHLHENHLTIVEAPCAFFVENEEKFGDDLCDEYGKYDDDSADDDTEYSGTEEGRENSHIFPDRDGNRVFLYDIRTCKRNPLMCVRCGNGERFKNKLCRRCYEKDMLIRRRSGDVYRASVKGINRGKAIFFDLELTGVYPYDEIISVSITDGYGNEIMDTLVRPEKRKQWNATVKIHGITPAMVENAPYLRELTPKIKAILLNSEIIVAYGISTDYAHIKKIFTEDEQKILEKKLRCCAKEYVRYISEYEPDINKSALVSAMEYFKIEWTGSAHTSMADTHACRFVWDKIFPACYTETEGEGFGKETEIISILANMPKTESLTFDEAIALAKKKEPSVSTPSQKNKKKSKPKAKRPQTAQNTNKNTEKTSNESNSVKQEIKQKEKAQTSPKPEGSKAQESGKDNAKTEQKKKTKFFASFFRSKKNNNGK
ncbi:MAG: 3'-5' exonuclease [Ruminococcaceae bacterium]|nr:3'-5' exonuclease [Oscillospiraceae bacterium]